MIIGFILGAITGSVITGWVFICSERKRVRESVIDLTAIMSAISRDNAKGDSR